MDSFSMDSCTFRGLVTSFLTALSDAFFLWSENTHVTSRFSYCSVVTAALVFVAIVTCRSFSNEMNVRGNIS